MASPTSSSSPSNNAVLAGWDRALERARSGLAGGARTVAVNAVAEASIKAVVPVGTPPPSPTPSYSGDSLDSYDRPDTPLSPMAKLRERKKLLARELAGEIKWDPEGACYVEVEADGGAATSPAAAPAPDERAVGGGAAAAAAAVESPGMVEAVVTFAAGLPVVNSVVSFFWGSSEAAVAAPVVTPPKAEEPKAAAGGAAVIAAVEGPGVMETVVEFTAGLPVINSVVSFLGLGSTAAAAAATSPLSTPAGTPPLNDAQRAFAEGLLKLQVEYPHGIPRVLYDALVYDLTRAEGESKGKENSDKDPLLV